MIVSELLYLELVEMILINFFLNLAFRMISLKMFHQNKINILLLYIEFDAILFFYISA